MLGMGNEEMSLRGSLRGANDTQIDRLGRNQSLRTSFDLTIRDDLESVICFKYARTLVRP